MSNIDPAIVEALSWAQNGPETSYDGKPLRAIVDDYAVVRGDLTEEYARGQLARIALRSADVRAAVDAARAEALRDAADAWQQGGWTAITAATKTGNPIAVGQRVSDWLRARAEATP